MFMDLYASSRVRRVGSGDFIATAWRALGILEVMSVVGGSEY